MTAVKGRLQRERSFTLLELIVVVAIIAILAVIAVPVYKKAVWGAEYREAQAMLRLISQAEETHSLETGSYVTCDEDDGVVPTCSSALHLSLPGNNWRFVVVNPLTPSPYCVQALTRKAPVPSGYIASWKFNPPGGDSDPVPGTCP